MPDDLTGLPTHREFPTGLCDQSPYAIFVDVDSLIWVNDQLGWPGGDAALSLLARAVVGEVAAVPGAAVFRIGGDELLIVLPGQTADSVEQLARALVGTVRALDIPYRRADQPARTRLEINAAVFRFGPRFLQESFGTFGFTNPGRAWIEEQIYREKVRARAVGVVVNLAEGEDAA